MKSKEPGVFRLASISDVHCGHSGTPTELIIQNLRKTFPDNSDIARLDMIAIVGDFFDRLLNLPDDNVTLIKRYMYSLLRLCAKRDITLIVLEGTKTHDWAQNKLWVEANELGQIGADLYYIDTLSIVHFDKFDMDFLFVPDDWRPEPDDTWKEVQQLLSAKSLEKVDFSFVHGSFAHQLPEFVAAPKHIGERYLEITRHYVLAGHVHTSSVYKDRLLANGSADRLTHGEEEAKGHWRVTVGKAEGNQIEFIENKGAKIYKTVDCTNLTVEEALDKIDVASTLPDQSSVRIVAEKNAPIFANLDLIRRTYPKVQWVTKVAALQETQKKLLTDMRASHREIDITRDNLFELMMTRIKTMTSDQRLIDRCERQLQERIGP